MRFSEKFSLLGDQAQFDFVDIPLHTDMRVFIDPHSLAITKTPWSYEAHSLATRFFQEVLDLLRVGDRNGALALLNGLREDNRTRLGYSKSAPQGTGLGGDRASPFLDAMEHSEAYKTGRIEDIEDTALFVPGIGVDIVSDMVTNVLREQLADYTAEQCHLHNVPMAAIERLRVWRPDAGWTTITRNLPTDGQRAILLAPRSVVRTNSSLRPWDYLKDFLDRYVDQGDLPATRSLEKVLQQVPMKRNGTPHRGQVRQKLKGKGSIKDVMSRITEDCPAAFKGYKARARNKYLTLTPEQLEAVNPRQKPLDLAPLIAEMRDASRNASAVWDAGQTVARALVAALHPLVQHPRRMAVSLKGFSTILFSNTGSTGLLWDARRRDAASDRPNLLVLGSRSGVSEATVANLDPVRLMQQTAAGLILVVGTSLEQSVRDKRPALVKAGVLPVTFTELANIAALDSGAEESLEALESLVNA